MKIHLAGFNVDTEVLRQLEEKNEKRTDITPEVISAAYARISRDPRTITEIRKTAREEVDKSRKSNSAIIFKMGHHSVAEHAVFNLDILGVSRYVMEELEKFRLCAYTEKSQRYITLKKDHVVPDEIKGSSLEKIFVEMIGEQNEMYFKLYQKLKKHVFDKNPELAKDPKKHNLLKGWAKEDSRYIVALATEAQVGQTINARNLELLLRRFASHPLSEIKNLGRAIYEQISNIAPSIVIFHEANDRDSKTYPELKKLSNKILANDCTNQEKEGEDRDEEIKLVDYTQDADDIIAASLLHTSSSISFEKCKNIIQNLSQEEKLEIFKTSWSNLQFYDSMLREFEYVNLTFNIVLSSACFGQLKRHRMSTITAQAYDPSLGVTIPKSIQEIGMEDEFNKLIEKTNQVYNQINEKMPLAAPYILTNSHRKRVLIRVNARELYHISRLREDTHAQWDIQNISKIMTIKAKEVMPLTFALIGGKDRYNQIYQKLYGKLPKVTQVALPGARKIG